MEQQPKPYTLDRVVRIIISFLIVGVLGYLIHITRDALIPFLLAWLAAYIINPIVLFFQKNLRIKNKLLAVVIVLILLLAVLVGVVDLIAPSIANQMKIITPHITHLFSEGQIGTIVPEDFRIAILDFLSNSNILSELSLSSSSDILQKALNIVEMLLSSSFSIVMFVVTLFAITLYLIFILKDYENINNEAISLIPEKYKENTMMVVEDLKEGMNRYFRGQSMIAFTVGILLAIGFEIIGLPLGILLGLFIGLLNMVPYLQIIGIAPMALLAFIKYLDTGESFIVVFGLAILVLSIVQLIQDLILVPKIMGKASGLNPAVILLSLSIWGTLMGVVGMIIALPLTSILLSYYKRFVVNKVNI